MLPIICFLAVLQHFAQGAPVELEISNAAGNVTILKTKVAPAWASAPGVRGTSQILWSCILTLVACVYTALHLNVPPHNEGQWQFLWRKIKWVAIALFAPEIVLYCACAQFWEGRRLIKKFNAIRDQETKARGLNHSEPNVSSKGVNLKYVVQQALKTLQAILLGKKVKVS